MQINTGARRSSSSSSAKAIALIRAARWLCPGGIAFAALAIGTGALADQYTSADQASTRTSLSATHGPSLGLRAGYGVPFGSTAQGYDLKGNLGGLIPLWLDVGYRLNPNIFLGGFFQFGFGLSPEGCGGSINCSQNDMRFGLQAHYHFLPAKIYDPWIGIGAGYEIFRQSVSGNLFGPFSGSGSASGFEFGNVQAGLDLKISKGFTLGPFATFTLAQFSSGDLTLTGTGTTTTQSGIQNKALHEWLMFGLKATVTINVDR